MGEEEVEDAEIREEADALFEYLVVAGKGQVLGFVEPQVDGTGWIVFCEGVGFLLFELKFELFFRPMNGGFVEIDEGAELLFEQGLQAGFKMLEIGRTPVNRNDGAPMLHLPAGFVVDRYFVYWHALVAAIYERYTELVAVVGPGDQVFVAEGHFLKMLCGIKYDHVCINNACPPANGRESEIWRDDGHGANVKTNGLRNATRC